MSQEDIMVFFDENPKQYFTIKEIHVIFKGQMNRATLTRCLRNIVKRKEYEVKLMYNVTGDRLSAYYGKSF